MQTGDQAVHLHVGGQTSGAEDLVVFLAANRAGLRRAGWGLYGFDVLSSGSEGLGAVMPEPTADNDAMALAASYLAARFAPDRRAGAEGFLVSAADLAGPMGELMMGRFHPHVRKRARVLREALGQPVERLVLVVQPYEALFHSVWMMLAMDRRMDAFAEYASALARFQGGWGDVGLALVEELGVRELVVQAAPLNPQQMLTALVPGAALRQPVEPLPKPRVTASAVAMIQRLQHQGTRLQPGQRDRLIAFHARQPQLRPDYGFSPLALSDLRGRYISDLDELAKAFGAQVMGVPTSAMAAE